MKRIFTIGVYGRKEDEFWNLLLDNKIQVFCDIRRRRGMRGKKYSFVNSTYLQEKLKEIGIEYIYIKDLAPTPEIREIQMKEDKDKKILKKDREELSESFKSSFNDIILGNYRPQSFFEKFNPSIENVVLFCVEKEPKACHRFLVADYLYNFMPNINITHLI